MDHEELRGEIPAYVAGTLAGDALERLEAHLRQCDDCADLVQSGREVAAAVRRRGGGPAATHADELALRAYALGGGDPEVARHIARCPSCELEVEAWKAAPGRTMPDRAAAGGPPPRPRASLRTLAALAAGLVVGVGIGLLRPLDNGLPRSPAAGPEPFTQPRQPAPPGWNGAVDLLLLGPPLRGHDPVQRFRLRPGQPFVLLATPLEIPEGEAPRSLRFEIRRPEGGVVWSTTLTAEQVRTALETADVVTLAVPPEVLPPGSYELRAEAPDASGAPPPVQAPFEIVPSP